jgi:scyllo-inositol 2-dehydrogenase (NAD+)
MAEDLRVALAGCGRMGVFTADRTRAFIPASWMPLSHADAIASVPGLRLTALSDLDPERLAKAGDLHGVGPEKRFADAIGMIEAVRPDIVSIATRSPGRAEILRCAVANSVRGIHCEKPLTPNLGTTTAVMRAVEDAGVAFTYGTVRRLMSTYRRVRELVADGAIGEVYEIAIDHGFRDLLLWSHPHTVDLLIFFGGTAVTEVSAACEFGDMPRTETFVDGDPAVRYAAIAFANGVQGLIGGGGGMGVRISGSAGILRIAADGARAEILRSRGKGDPYFDRIESVDVPAGPSGTAQAFSELLAAINGGVATGITPGEVVLNQRILSAIAMSGLRKGLAVAPEDVPDALTITGRFGDFYA